MKTTQCTACSLLVRFRTGAPLIFAAMSDTRRGKDGDFDALRAEGVAGAEELGALENRADLQTNELDASRFEALLGKLPIRRETGCVTRLTQAVLLLAMVGTGRADRELVPNDGGYAASIHISHQAVFLITFLAGFICGAAAMYALVHLKQLQQRRGMLRRRPTPRTIPRPLRRIGSGVQQPSVRRLSTEACTGDRSEPS